MWTKAIISLKARVANEQRETGEAIVYLKMTFALKEVHTSSRSFNLKIPERKILYPWLGLELLIHLTGELRLYIKHHFRHPFVTQSVATLYIADGLRAIFRSGIYLLTRFHKCSLVILRSIKYNSYLRRDNSDIYIVI